MSGIVEPPTIPPLPPTFGMIPTSDITDPATFRAHFPAFASTVTYPDATVQFFLDMGTAMCGPAWCQFRQMGAELFCAHMLALQQYAGLRAAGGATGAVPGLSTGLLSSKSVSKVSVSYDLSSTSMQGHGPWNYTMYGQQFIWWMDLVGTGGYETLGVGMPDTLTGTVMTWSRGVMGTYIGAV